MKAYLKLGPAGTDAFGCPSNGRLRKRLGLPGFPGLNRLGLSPGESGLSTRRLPGEPARGRVLLGLPGGVSMPNTLLEAPRSQHVLREAPIGLGSPRRAWPATDDAS